MPFEVGAPHRTVPHLLADLVELSLVSSYEGYRVITPAIVESIVKNLPPSPDEVDVLQAEADNPDVSDAEKVDVLAVYMEDVWKQLEYRRDRFDDAYPFDLGDQSITLKDGLTHGMRIYRFLLACSRLRSFPLTLRVAWAAKFSRISAHALKQMIPVGFITRVFDANSEDRQQYYGTDLRVALKKLGEDLHCLSINEDVCDQQSASGDGGIDIVATYPFTDSASTTVAVVGQCAARETEWPKKRFEGHPLSLRAFFTLLCDPLNVMFIPLCFRQGSGAWTNDAHASGTVVLDRVRLVNLLMKDPEIANLIEQEWFLDFEIELEKAVH